jgi:hypothetical protein
MKITVTDIFLNHIKNTLIDELRSDLNEIHASEPLLDEIDKCLNNFFVDLCFSQLENKKTVSAILPEMIDHWLIVTGIRDYLLRHHQENWGIMTEVIESNLFGAFINAHYDYHHQKS